MPMKQIGTDRQVAALKPTARPYEVAIEGVRGLCMRVYPTGTKSFELRYTAINGARRRHPLGNYPGLSLAEARAKAAALRVGITGGADPAGERAAERLRARTGETLNELAEAYWKAAAVGLHGGRKRPKRASTMVKERQWWKHIEPKLGTRRFTEIRRADVKAYMRQLASESGLRPASIADIGSLLQSVMGFAVHEDRLEANPVIGLARPLAVTSRDRMFSDESLGVIVRVAIEASEKHEEGSFRDDKRARLGPSMGLAIRLLIMTLTRRNEIAGARWDEFDLRAKQWTIPAERAKANHLHVVPLTDEMIALLEQLENLHPKSPHLFPSSGPTEEHMDPHAITRAFSRISARHKLGPGSPHDVRRTGATTLVGRCGVTRLVVGMLLGHTAREGAAVTGVYDRHTYIPEKRAALEKWQTHLDRLALVDDAAS